MRGIILIILVFGSLPIALIKPHIGILVYSWIGYMSPQSLAWSNIYDFRLAMMVGAVTVIGWLVSHEPKRLPMTPVTVLMISYMLWVSLTTVFALNPEAAIAKWTLMTKIFLMTYMTMFLIYTRERIHLLVWVIVVSLGIYGIRGGLGTILSAGQMRVWGPEFGFISDNNALALALVMLLPLIWYLNLATRKVYVRWGLYATAGLTLLAILGTYSRGGFLALGVTAFALFLKTRYKLFTVVLVAPVLVTSLLFVPQKWWDRMETIQNYQEDDSAMRRIQAWKYAIVVAGERPITGGGFDIWDKQTWLEFMDFNPGNYGLGAHSIYFEVLGEHGYVGLLLFLLLGIYGLRTGGWIIRHSRDRPQLRWAQDLASMIQVALVAYATAGAFLNLATFDLYYHLLAILVLTKQLVVKSLSEDEVAVEAPRGSWRPATPKPVAIAQRAKRELPS